MRYLLEIFVVLFTTLVIGGCSSNSVGSSEVTGQFVDDPVSGLAYECSSGPVGVTDLNGNYTCAVGDNVTFSIGDVLIGTVVADTGIATPYDFFPSDQDAAINLARLLQSVDSDPSDSIITLDTGLVALLDLATDFASPTFETDVEADLSITLVSVEDAQTQLNETIVSAGEEIPDGANIPVADAGVDQNVHNNDVVALDGSSSSDADGDSLTYTWSITSKPLTSGATLSNATVVNPNFTADVSGVYVVQLIVNDGSVNSAPDELTVTATFLNAAPVADAGIDQNVNTTDSVNLNGSGSTDADTLDLLTYSWTITSKPATSVAALSSATVVDPTFTADLDGTYEVQLIVNDGTVDSTPDTVVVTASTVNSAPVANAGADQDVSTNDTVTLSGSGSTDTNLDSLTYLWNMTSKPVGSSAILSSTTVVGPTFTADVAGSYVVSLVVNDGTVDSDNTDTVTITATDEVIWHFSLPYGTVISPYTNRKWLDRNLGATQVCTARNDGLCYGNYFQWGRSYNGHNLIGLPTSPILVTSLLDDAVYDTENPFRVTTTSPADWLAAGIDDSGSIRATAWGNATDNSVCPTGYRVPTMNELNAETIDVGKNTLIKVFEDFLKLPAAGWRNFMTGAYEAGGEFGSMFIWSNSISAPSNAFYLNISISGYSPNPNAVRAYGFTVRCIKN